MWNTEKQNFNGKTKVYWDVNNGSTAMTSDSYGTIKTAIGSTTSELNAPSEYGRTGFNSFAAYVNGKWRYCKTATIGEFRLL